MALETGTNAVGKRYRVHDCLGVGSMGAVYRATDRLTGQTVALKRITAPIDQLDFATEDTTTLANIRLASTLKSLTALRQPHIVSLLDYGFDAEGQPYYTLPLLDHPQTILQAGRDQALEVQVRLLAETLQALAYLHWQGIVHRNLKPDHVMVIEGQVKVLDYGLSRNRLPDVEALNKNNAQMFAYKSPETLRGQAATTASDLFAFGVIAYEMFTGQHPFSDGDAARMVKNILDKPADVWTADLPEELSQVLYHLLLKEPEHRYQEAGDVLSFLCQATGQPMPSEPIEVRERFLQPTKFVGRTAELGQLTKAVKAAFSHQGSGWLVGGESGIGKSRLLSTLSAAALAEGAAVLHGQAVSEGSARYHIWREPLRRLALMTDLDDDEAGVLKAVIPDLEARLERLIPDAPPLDPESAQNRLSDTVIGLLRRQEPPLLLLLEDLEWAGSASLTLIQRIMRTVGDLPLLLVGSFREEENPKLPQTLPQMQVLSLRRLETPQIAELSTTMLGEVGHLQEIVNMLRRETEGNPFFLVEMIRALAEEAGGASEVGKRTLSGNILAGGTRRIVQRRLSLAPETARTLLEIAAVAGRVLDLEVIRAASQPHSTGQRNAPASPMDLDSWLMICADVMVLEWAEGQWRFAHDKLREGLLLGLNEVKLSTLHRRVGEAIELVYHDAPDQSPALAYHFRQAGIRDKAVRYLVQAGDHARLACANNEAIVFYRQALTIIEEASEDGDSASYPGETPIYENLGDVLELTRRYAEAREAYQNALSRDVSGDPLLLARLHRKVGSTWSSEHQSGDALKRLNIAEAILGSEPPPEQASLWQREQLLIGIERIRAHYVQGEDAVSLSRAIAETRKVLASDHRAMPGPLAAVLKSAVQSWEVSQRDQSETFLLEAFSLARQIPYTT